MHTSYTDPATGLQNANKSSNYTSQIIGSAIVGAAIGAATMILSDPQKRETTVQKAKDIGGRMKSAVDVMKTGHEKIMDDATETFNETASVMKKDKNTDTLL